MATTYSEWRDRFIVTMAAHGLTVTTIRELLRLSTVMDRLAVAQCNGDWPADHGDAWPTAPCPQCGAFWHPSALKRSSAMRDRIASCPDCRTSARIARLLPVGFRAHFAGDPRGCVVQIQVPGMAAEDAIGVPVRG